MKQASYIKNAVSYLHNHGAIVSVGKVCLADQCCNIHDHCWTFSPSADCVVPFYTLTAS